MAKARKILIKVLSGSKNVRFGELQILLEALGFTLDRISGSHHIYAHQDLPQPISIQPDKNQQAKVYQLRQLVKLIEQYNLRIED